MMKDKEGDIAYVADVRRCLASIRKIWINQTRDSPLIISEMVSSSCSISDFSFRFVLGHHIRRPSR